jgi:hypothetical protein
MDGSHPPFRKVHGGMRKSFNDVLVIFPQSNLKNRRELEYSLIGIKFPPNISLRILYTVKKNFLKFSKSVHAIKA